MSIKKKAVLGISLLVVPYLIVFIAKNYAITVKIWTFFFVTTNISLYIVVLLAFIGGAVLMALLDRKVFSSKHNKPKSK